MPNVCRPTALQTIQEDVFEEEDLSDTETTAQRPATRATANHVAPVQQVPGQDREAPGDAQPDEGTNKEGQDNQEREAPTTDATHI